jgi:hypothetical protein
VSASLEYVMLKIVHFSMAKICCGQNGQFQHYWNMLWSKSTILAWLEYVMVKIVSFSIAGMCHGQNCQF